MVEAAIASLRQFAHILPLEIFVFGGAVFEEIFAPLPSPIVMILTGTLAATQNRHFLAILFLCLIGSIGKTAGAWLFYVLGDKAEDIIVPRFGKFLGLRHDDLEHFGQHFKGSWKDEVILLMLRSIPVMPSSPVSIVCGILKIQMRTFLVATFGGFYLRNLFFLTLGYLGLDTYDSLLSGIESAESLMKALVVGGAFLLLCWLYYRRMKGRPAQWLQCRHPQDEGVLHVEEK